ncbi:MAG: chemotaxis protein CheW [Rhodothermales bacterium]
MKNRKQYCTFYLNDLMFGIDVLKVQEIILPQEMTEVPLSTPSIRGLINLRGQVVTAIDLRRWLGFVPVANGNEAMNVVIRAEEDILSFLVDDIGDVLEPDEGSFEPPPETLKENIRELINGVYKLENQLLLVMNAERTFELFAEKFNSSPKLAIK